MKLLNMIITMTNDFKEETDSKYFRFSEVLGFSEHANFVDISLPKNRQVMLRKEDILSIDFDIDESDEEEPVQLRLV